MNAFEYLMSNYAMLESEYPFTYGDTGENTFNCLYSESKSSQHNVKVSRYANQDYMGMLSITIFKRAIQNQPIIIAITANNKYIHSYNSGVIDAEDCSTNVLYHDEALNDVNHGVLAVGYGYDKTTGLEYALVKNSWNTTWGD